mgnify:CR=1 FL=1
MFTIEKKIKFLDISKWKKLRQCIQCIIVTIFKYLMVIVKPFERCTSNGELLKLLTKVNDWQLYRSIHNMNIIILSSFTKTERLVSEQ